MASLNISIRSDGPSTIITGNNEDDGRVLMVKAVALILEKLDALAMPTSARLAVVPTAKLAAELSDSFRAVLFAHGFVVSHGLGGSEPNDPLTVTRFEALLDELGKNAAQRVLDLATNHQLDAEDAHE